MIDLSDGCRVDKSRIAEIKVSHDQDFITVRARNGIGHVHEPKLGESVHVAIIRILEAASGIRVVFGGEVTTTAPRRAAGLRKEFPAGERGLA